MLWEKHFRRGGPRFVNGIEESDHEMAKLRSIETAEQEKEDRMFRDAATTAGKQGVEAVDAALSHYDSEDEVSFDDLPDDEVEGGSDSSQQEQAQSAVQLLIDAFNDIHVEEEMASQDEISEEVQKFGIKRMEQSIEKSDQELGKEEE
jgi:hypothetical protein